MITLILFLSTFLTLYLKGGWVRCILCKNLNLTESCSIVPENLSQSFTLSVKPWDVRIAESWKNKKKMSTNKFQLFIQMTDLNLNNLIANLVIFMKTFYEKLTKKCSGWLGHIHLPIGGVVNGGSRQSRWKNSGQKSQGINGPTRQLLKKLM